ncbi:FAD/NAD(P)-binding domain-containing protein [Daldinia caldariorum]|uniref:FAD/NAD(P)-binding domain-containing protein n=1 Tax=Daldinia caldariorum TaxID=326644 RepID=UPI002008D09B|nr:FAD/NAD(P)-binding domain-containing protein [Daldinia caldariorum]KAI1463294.1 FAD/NAD(P)-binding domain-containing protein [Daldinia caldariorum]
MNSFLPNPSILIRVTRGRRVLIPSRHLSQHILQYTVRSFATNGSQYSSSYKYNKTLHSSVGMSLNILIVGAGVAGPALALLLQKSDPNYNITIVERFPSLRVAGQQIDIKNQGVDVLKKMGLLDAIKEACVNETGLEVVDSAGRRKALMGINPAGQRRITLTSEFEIMRGDMVKVLYDASVKQDQQLKQLGGKGGLTYEFSKELTELTQTDKGVEVTFSDGKKQSYDLVVAADGQASRTRRMAFGQEANDEAFKSIGVHAAYYDIPRAEDEETLARVYMAPGKRMLLTRTSGRPATQVLLFTMAGAEDLRMSYKESVEKQKEAFDKAFRGAGWQTERLLDGMKTTGNFWAHELAQIKMKQLYAGRVALLGDAGYCPTPFTGMGATGCLIGAYVLAGELARHKNDVPSALRGYDRVVRPGVDEIQKLPTELMGVFFPSSKLGVWILQNVMWAVSKIEPLTYRPKPDGAYVWHLPEYPELKL